MTGFFDRWAARKAESRTPEPVTEAPEPAHAVPAAPEAALPEGMTLEEALAALPDLESITAATDIRPFLQGFVPQALRNAALRRAWAADPVISTHLDVARDYAWDFNTGAGPVGYAPTLAREIADRSLDLLKGRPAPAPEPEAEPAPEAAGPEIPLAPEGEVAPENAAPQSLVKMSQRHGGALPG